MAPSQQHSLVCSASHELIFSADREVGGKGLAWPLFDVFQHTVVLIVLMMTYIQPMSKYQLQPRPAMQCVLSTRLEATVQHTQHTVGNIF